MGGVYSKDRAVVGAYTPCGCSAPAQDGRAAGDGALGVSTREPGHRGITRRLYPGVGNPQTLTASLPACGGKNLS
jgi:hypothetical protein